MRYKFLFILFSIISLFSCRDETIPQENNWILPIKEAINNKDLSAIDSLIELGASINQTSDNEWTPLMVAVDESDTKLAKKYLEKGASLKDDRYLLHALKGGDVELVSSLLKHGANPNSHWTIGCREYGIHIAAQKGRLDLVKLLVENGAEVNSQTDVVQPGCGFPKGKFGFSAFDIAATPEIKTYLKSNGGKSGKEE